MKRTLFYAAVLSASLLARAAHACEYDIDLARLPGETAEAFQAREERTYSDLEVIRSYTRETADFQQATKVYLGRVLSSNAGRFSDFSILPTAVVRPLLAVKGNLPGEDQTLSDVLWTSCGNHGDGDASRSTKDTLVYVFEGIPNSKIRPRGIDSLRAADVRSYELLTPLYEFGQKAAELESSSTVAAGRDEG